MRVTQNMIAESFMRNMYQNLSRLGDKNDRISSQRKIRRPSDDPVGTALAMRLRRQLAAMDQYKSNAEDAITWLKDTESALTNTGDIIHRLSDLTIQAANGTLTSEDREKILHEVKELKEQLLQEANSTHVDRYLFSGYHVDEQPFVKDDDGKIVPNPKIQKPNDVRILSANGKAIVDESQFVIDEIEGLKPGKYKLEVEGVQNFTVTKEVTVDGEKKEEDIEFGEVKIAKEKANPDKTTVTLKNDDVEISFELKDLNNGGSDKTITFMVNETGIVEDELADSVKVISGKLDPEKYTIAIGDQTQDTGINAGTEITITSEDDNAKINDNSKLALTFKKGIDINAGNETIFEITPGDMDYHLGRNDLMTVNLQGREIFEDVFENVQALEDALEKDESSNLSGDVLANIKGSLNHVLKYRSQVGARSKRLEMTVNKMESSYVDYTDLLSKTEDLDMAKAATELKMEESVYRAALAVGARIIQPNLADFLR